MTSNHELYTLFKSWKLGTTLYLYLDLCIKHKRLGGMQQGLYDLNASHSNLNNINNNERMCVNIWLLITSTFGSALYLVVHCAFGWQSSVVQHSVQLCLQIWMVHLMTTFPSYSGLPNLIHYLSISNCVPLINKTVNTLVLRPYLHCFLPNTRVRCCAQLFWQPAGKWGIYFIHCQL